MAAHTLFDSMNRTVLAVFGEPAVYIRAGVETVIAKAVWDDNYASVDPNTGATIISSDPMIGIRMSDIPGGESQKGDHVRRAGITYRVSEWHKDSEGHAKILLKKIP